jgi:uncharacterized protein YaeQ
VDRIRKATRLSPAVKIYSFNSKSDTWWAQGQAKFKELPVAVLQLPWASIQALAAMIKRTMNLAVTITGGTAYIASDLASCEVSWLSLQAA